VKKKCDHDGTGKDEENVVSRAEKGTYVDPSPSRTRVGIRSEPCKRDAQLLMVVARPEQQDSRLETCKNVAGECS
jgi:hypothetical protein